VFGEHSRHIFGRGEASLLGCLKATVNPGEFLRCRLVGVPLQCGIYFKGYASKFFLSLFRLGFDPFHRVGEELGCHHDIIANDRRSSYSIFIQAIS
jgi:hypothetical protein